MNQNFFNVSVIIPSNHRHKDLILLMHAICNQTIKPSEIVIVDSSSERAECPAEISSLCTNSGIHLIYERRTSVYPGEARNIGIRRANCKLIALIDVKTIPQPDWLDKSLKLIGEGALGVWGSTYFCAETNLEMLVRDGLFGTYPRKTLPGSVFRREVFEKVGEFIDWVRAGEDTEWMLRVEVHKIEFVTPENTTVNYTGLIGSDLKQLIKKWYRNYTMSNELPHLFSQKILLWLIIYPMIIFMSFNWNYLIADWRMDSPFYLEHITKIIVAVPFFIYLIARGFLIPLKRGVNIFKLFPVRFLGILLICFIADGVKALVFAFPRKIK